ncbi:hypothetical protein [Croceicoccus naphthovorans]|uniref:Uncharacterized protein n=1 Tax=Croceicoccus naphthovorans TaxID=1348774 RepID=A0A0G3XF70_9SPHN|nr:hypothetical protein [Croceicoccus naphthovorans]AKM10160.1 hypothetical protein AB433_09540 [Croceicoccus naphthovorans]MBB3990610.1 hypothetical protein [Croceicoccus naphthovorans]
MADSPAATGQHFVFWAPSYDENIGGVIAIHSMCARMRELGYKASIWPAYLQFPHDYASAKGWIKRKMVPDDYSFGPFTNPTAGLRQLRNAVVVYPETVFGNPLQGKKVVRWLLYRPTDAAAATFDMSRDFFAYYMPEFAGGNVNQKKFTHLRIQHLHAAYQDKGLDRTGDCYLIHKGKNRTYDKHPKNAIYIDNMSHEEKANAFQTCDRLYSYDFYSMNNIYASICGCVPIIIPEDGVSEREWMSEEHRRWGLAYGEDRIDWAKSTRGKLLERVHRSHLEENSMIVKFAASCFEFWH